MSDPMADVTGEAWDQEEARRRMEDDKLATGAPCDHEWYQPSFEVVGMPDWYNGECCRKCGVIKATLPKADSLKERLRKSRCCMLPNEWEDHGLPSEALARIEELEIQRDAARNEIVAGAEIYNDATARIEQLEDQIKTLLAFKKTDEVKIERLQAKLTKAIKQLQAADNFLATSELVIARDVRNILAELKADH